MPFDVPPRFAAWQHQEGRSGFEVAFLRADGAGLRLEGYTAAAEGHEAWAVGYVIDLNSDWMTRRTWVWSVAAAGRRELNLRADGGGRWWVNGESARHLDGCVDVDLESSALTNAFPVHHLGLEVGQEADAPAAYVRTPDLGVKRLEQRYRRLDDHGSQQRYHYSAPAFGFECQLLYDHFGLVLEYPGIAVRAA